jgi:hypothetical protein
VVSSDLSHFHDYGTAQRLDAATATAIEQGNWARLGPGDACGFLAVAGLLQHTTALGLRARRIALCNSGMRQVRRRESSAMAPGRSLLTKALEVIGRCAFGAEVRPNVSEAHVWAESKMPRSSSRPRSMCAEPSSLVDGTLVKALARAHRWQGMLEGGEYGSIEELDPLPRGMSHTG